MIRITVVTFICISMFMIETAFAASDSVVIPGDLKITGTVGDAGLVFPDNSVQYKAGAEWPHSHFSHYWAGNNTTYGLEVENFGTGDGIRALSYATSNDYAAIYAVNMASTGYGTGVYGYSGMGVGVYAGSQNGDGLEATAVSSGKSAVYAHSTDANGVWGVSTNNFGVHGISTAKAGVFGQSTGNHGVEGYNDAGNYGGYFTSNNYRGGFIGTLNYAWYGAVIDGGLYITNGSCVNCAAVYQGMNKSSAAILPGELVAAAGVATDAATNQPVMLVRSAQSASDPVIGVVVGGASKPGSNTGPDKIQSSKIMPGEYMLIAVSGLAQARVADKSVAIGERLSAGSAGAVVTADTGSSVARVMSAPDKNGLVWVMVNGR
jgi:hypothetical protein